MLNADTEQAVNLQIMTVRKHIYFSGRVQGVGFRYQATYLARNLGLTGWVKNLWDGRVEMEVQGEESTIRKLLIQLRGQRYIRIEHMEIEDIEPETEKGFGVTGW